MLNRKKAGAIGADESMRSEWRSGYGTVDTMKHTSVPSNKRDHHRLLIASVLLVISLSFQTVARGDQPLVQPGDGSPPEHGDVAKTGQKLSNPVSDVWALFTEFDLNFLNGNVNSGREKVGGRMIFQPILPIPLHGTGDEQWKFITRPTIPFQFSERAHLAAGFEGHPDRPTASEVEARYRILCR